MKIKNVFILLLISFFVISCGNQKTTTINLKDLLIEKILSESDKVFIEKSEKTIIYKSQYCEEIDCEKYFQDYKNEVLIYPKEDLFMRGISNYLEIYNIDEENGKAKFRKVSRESMEIVGIEIE